ncbi:hypothetical protein FOCC_FOCC015792 [Frankliniella occidentalis]|nr:hypothetical protein FOCC_FOCC015792 [Frankliniella occidentalis]
MVYHHYWKCQLSSKNKTTNGKRNKLCPATLDIKIKKVNRDTIKNDRKYLNRDEPLAGVITLKGEHNHPTASSYESLGFLRVSEEVKLKFYKYFNEGNNPTVARSLEYNDIKMNCKDWKKEIANGSKFPAERTVYHLFNKWRTSELGESWGTDPLLKLKEKCSLYKAEGSDVFIHEDEENWAVLVVTPIAKRAQKLSQAGEIIFVDSTSSVEFSQSTLTVVLTATPAGAVPIAILIHDGQSGASYRKAFNLLKTHQPKCFGGKDAPDIFMTDHSDAEKGALKLVWPSALQYLCHFHVAQSEWRWLLKSENGIAANERQGLMQILKDIMYAQCTEELEEALAKLSDCSSEKYKKHVDSELLNIKEEWVKMFRADVINRGHDTNNYAEACIRVLKDIILSRTKAYNVTAMVDFIVKVWETYFESKLLYFAYGRKAAPYLKYKRLSERMPPGTADKIQKIDSNMYMVPSGNQETSDLFYEVDVSIGWCSCPSGRHGAFCKHQALIHKTYGGVFPNVPPIDAKGRYSLARLAFEISDCPPPSFFLSIDETVALQKQGKDILSEDVVLPLQNSNYTNPTSPSPAPLDTVSNAEENKEATEARITDLNEALLIEITRMNNCGKICSIPAEYAKVLERLLHRIRGAKTPSQAMTTVLSLSSRANCTGKRSRRINVMPTSTARRRPGITRGNKRVSAGRPPGRQPINKRSKKRAHKLVESIRANKGHVKAHGH